MLYGIVLILPFLRHWIPGDWAAGHAHDQAAAGISLCVFQCAPHCVSRCVFKYVSQCRSQYVLQCCLCVCLSVCLSVCLGVSTITSIWAGVSPSASPAFTDDGQLNGVSHPRGPPAAAAADRWYAREPCGRKVALSCSLFRSTSITLGACQREMGLSFSHSPGANHRESTNHLTRYRPRIHGPE